MVSRRDCTFDSAHALHLVPRIDSMHEIWSPNHWPRANSEIGRSDYAHTEKKNQGQIASTKGKTLRSHIVNQSYFPGTHMILMYYQEGSLNANPKVLNTVDVCSP